MNPNQGLWTFWKETIYKWVSHEFLLLEFVVVLVLDTLVFVLVLAACLGAPKRALDSHAPNGHWNDKEEEDDNEDDTDDKDQSQSEEEKMEEILAYIDDKDAKLAHCEALSMEYKKYEKQLEMEITEYENLDEIRTDLNMKKELWHGLAPGSGRLWSLWVGPPHLAGLAQHQDRWKTRRPPNL